MKFIDLFKKTSPQNTSELDRAVDAVVAIEARRDRAKEALEKARKALESEYAQSISDDDTTEPSAAEVVEAQHRLDAIERLLRDTKVEAMGVIASGISKHRKRLETVESELGETIMAIGRRRVETLAAFVKKHDLSISWPSKHNAGTISLPSIGLDPEEIDAVATAVSTTRHLDPDDGKLESLRAERMRLNVLIGSSPELGLSTLVSQRIK